jgi:TRAP-type C4-dicarboxylate transport system permease large subunit
MADGGQGARPLIFGSLAAGGTPGILIPPSIPMIISASIR